MAGGGDFGVTCYRVVTVTVTAQSRVCRVHSRPNTFLDDTTVSLWSLAVEFTLFRVAAFQKVVSSLPTPLSEGKHGVLSACSQLSKPCLPMMIQLGGDFGRKRVRASRSRVLWQRGDRGEVRRGHQVKGGVNFLARNHAVRPNISHLFRQSPSLTLRT